MPDLEFANAQVEATTNGHVRQGRRRSRSTSSRRRRPTPSSASTSRPTSRRRRASSTRPAASILHPDHQEIHLPPLAVRTQGVEWRTAPGSEATIKYGHDRIELENVKLVSGDQSLDVDGTLALKGDAPSGALDVQARNVDLQQLETLLLQNRGFAGRLTRRREDHRHDGGARRSTGASRSTTAAFQTYKYESLVADVDYTGDAIGVDATLQQSPTEQITAKGTCRCRCSGASTGGHTSRPTAGRSSRPADQVHGDQPRARPGLHRRASPTSPARCRPTCG